ncbi:MAG: lytic transglycosylase domain-containing protein [Proteobacteria bacterium]|nr:lytic transglycosylase domain-containing protein [Pseudomonadota bacterium]
MRPAPRYAAAILAMLAAAAPAPQAHAQGPGQGRPDPIAAIRADRWSDAEAAAASFADPVARKLVLYYRLLAPNGAGAAEIAAFMAQNPDWPNQALLEKRRQEALAVEADGAVLATECARAPLTVVAALLRCAEALPDQADADARRAWVLGIADPAAERAFLARWAGAIRPQDQRERFDALAWGGEAAAAQRQVARLDPADRPPAEARLAFRRDDPAAPALFAALTASQRAAPWNAAGLFLEQARYLRRAGQNAAALAFWTAGGAAAEAAVPPQHAGALWSERMILARRLVKDGDAAGAANLAAAHGPGSPEQVADAEFFAGFLKLRRLNDPAGAARHFQALADMSGAALTQSRAHYWLGRAAAARNADPAPEYAKAAAWPTTFYGQLGILALAQDPVAKLRAVRDPAATRAQVLDFTGREVVRAAVMLVAWGDPRRAHAFILRMDELAPDVADRALNARFALALGMPDMAVFIARRMGRDGVMLPEAGWPIPVEPPSEPGVDAALALGVMRQESSFDVAAVSPSGARGLMQLMPPTALEVGRTLSTPINVAALTVDAALNMRLGTTYLAGLIAQFAGSVPLAVVGYNAGPHRVTQWLADYGDPRSPVSGGPDIIDWIELIPLGEPRNYVQRVLENTFVYSVKLRDAAPVHLAQWTP